MSSSTATPAAAVDPPVPNRTTRLHPPTAAIIANDKKSAAVVAAIALGLAALAFHYQLALIAYLLGGAAVLSSCLIFAKKLDVGQCPYCMTQFRELNKQGAQIFHCRACGEYSQIENRLVRPLDVTTYSDEPKFEAPLFKDCSLPNACAACGAPATRFDTLSATSTHKTLAAVSAASGVAILRKTKASVAVPYCDQHKDAVLLSLNWQKKPILSFSSLRMMRRYAAVNKGRDRY